MSTRLTLIELAEFARSMVNRQRSCNLVPVAKTALILYPEDADALAQLATVLERMAPHSDSIRRVITNAQ
jgi:hypothetical protein